jgi:hypothetical protein
MIVLCVIGCSSAIGRLFLHVCGCSVFGGPSSTCGFGFSVISRFFARAYLEGPCSNAVNISDIIFV